ncbi:putative carboxypeptidase s [Rosellinia necatrix]|uniref:Putative carboxypeptidase s n=1 Tax=Rosellinia necatrix TaxID=77044 RepID=A0A1S7UL81_ROSNE|nr:putative carboxypeptidase s [Rosellinia necatrix]
MTFSEKGEPLLPAPRAAAPKSRWRSVGALLLHAIAFALLLRISYGVYERLAVGEDPSASRAKCPQVEPLVPGQQSPALSEMEEHLRSDKFRNETIERMAGAVRIPTQSYDDLGPIGEDPRWDTMYDFADYLKSTFPLVHGAVTLEKVNTHGLLYTWKGTDASLLPTVLMAHQDVVPVAEATVDQWTHPPYSGFYDGKYIWGRGSSDCKNNLIGILEAVELLLDAGFEPKRTVILSFGFDEEVSGLQGAGHLAKALIDRYGKDGAAIIIDEGSGIASAWGSTFALPGVAEKGYIDVEIVVRMPGGHSSIPPAHSGIGVASELVALVESHPYEPHFHAENPYLGLLECGNAYGPEFPASLRKHLPWKERSCPAKKDKLALEAAKQGDATKYLFTTSLAVDIINGGVKSNALPERTSVLVNHRVNVGDHATEVQAKMAHLARAVAAKHNLTLQAFTDEPEVPSSIKLSALRILEPAPVTPTAVDGAASPYGVLSGTTRALYGESLLVAPALMTGNTDTRYYWDLTRHIFRYAPGYDPEQGFGLGGIHTVNEKVSVQAHISGVRWYSMFIRNMDEADLV